MTKASLVRRLASTGVASTAMAVGLSACDVLAGSDPCAFPEEPARSVDAGRRLEKCAEKRRVTLQDVRRYMGSDYGASRDLGTTPLVTWAYDLGRKRGNDHCTVVVYSRRGVVEDVNITNC